jgi:hypothetical protein
LFFAGCVATVKIALFAPLLAEVAPVSPAEYFADGVKSRRRHRAGARGSLIKALGMVCVPPVRHGRHRREFRRHPLAFGQSELADASVSPPRHGVLRHDRCRAQPGKP